MNETWKPLNNPGDKKLVPWQKLETTVQDALVDDEKGNIRHSPPFTKTGTLGTGTGTVRWTAPEDGTIIYARATVNTQPTGAAVIIDVNKNGTTIFTTQANRPTIAVSTNTATGTPDAAGFVAGDYFQVDIDQVGSTVAGADLVVQIVYQATGFGNDTITSAADLTVLELDGSPSVSGVKSITVTNGKLTDNGSGSVSLDLSGPSGGTPALTYGTSNSAGTASTFVRTDGQLALFDATAPSTQAIGDAAAAGTAGVAARRDHKHAVTNPLTTKGDLIAGGASGAINRLGVGTDNQVLTADSAQSLGVKWATPASGFADPTTTKGDLIVHGTSTTRLGVGSDAQVLTADSTQTLGVKWATPSSGSGITHYAEVHLASAQTISDNTDTIVKFDTKDNDPDTAYNTSTGLYTCPVAGTYLVSGCVAFSSDIAAGKRTANSIQKNGSSVGRTANQLSGQRYLPFSATVKCAANDTLAVGIYQNSGGSLTTATGGIDCQAAFTLLHT